MRRYIQKKKKKNNFPISILSLLKLLSKICLHYFKDNELNMFSRLIVSRVYEMKWIVESSIGKLSIHNIQIVLQMKWINNWTYKISIRVINYLKALITQTMNTISTTMAMMLSMNIFRRYRRWYSAALANSSAPASTFAPTDSKWLATVSVIIIIN